MKNADSRLLKELEPRRAKYKDESANLKGINFSAFIIHLSKRI
jgi:hypothetical protein